MRALLLLVLSGCGNSGLSDAGSTNDGAGIRVLVAASAHRAAERSIGAFKQQHTDAEGLKVELVAGPSNGLALQILAGASADIFVSANPAWTDLIEDHCDSVSPLMSNQLVLAQPRRVVGSARELKSLADLSSPAVGRIAIATESVPVGDYARQAISKLSDQDRSAIQSKLVFAKDSSALLAWLESEVVDAAFIYRSDLANSNLYLREAVSINPNQHEPIVYTIARLKTEGVKKSLLADKLYRWLRSKEGQAIFKEAGFQPAL